MKFQTVLFDFDYTLADSSRGIIKCVNYALTRLGHPPALEPAIRQTIGLSLPEMLKELAGSQYAHQSQSFFDLFVERAEEVMLENTVLFPGVPQLLAGLDATGITLGVVTSKFRRRIEQVMQRDGLLEHLSVIVGAEDVSMLKPDPESLHLAMHKAGASPEQALYVGDNLVDAEAAQRAGIPFVAVRSGMTDPVAFGQYDCHVIIEDVRALPEWLSYLAGEIPFRPRAQLVT